MKKVMKIHLVFAFIFSLIALETQAATHIDKTSETPEDGLVISKQTQKKSKLHKRQTFKVNQKIVYKTTENNKTQRGKIVRFEGEQMILSNKEGDLNVVEVSTLKTIRRKYTVIHVLSMLSLLILYGFVMFCLMILWFILSGSKIISGAFSIGDLFFVLSEVYFPWWWWSSLLGAVGFWGIRSAKTFRLGKKWKAEVKPME